MLPTRKPADALAILQKKFTTKFQKMKKIYLLFLLFTLLQNVMHAQCLVNGIFTRPDSAINTQNPSMINNFNWMERKYITNAQGATPGNDSIFSPIYQPDNIIIDNLRLALDMKPTDGWELLRRQFGFLQNGSLQNPKPEQLYIVMYNKYSSILEYFMPEEVQICQHFRVQK